jgi:hypothetical protein
MYGAVRFEHSHPTGNPTSIRCVFFTCYPGAGQALMCALAASRVKMVQDYQRLGYLGAR